MLYKKLLIATTCVTLISTSSYAADDLQIADDGMEAKLKSVKELFNKSKDSAPKAPEIISNRPEVFEFEDDKTNSDSVTDTAVEPIADKIESEVGSELEAEVQPTLEIDKTEPLEPQDLQQETNQQNSFNNNNAAPVDTNETTKEQDTEEKEREFISRVDGQSILFEQNKIRSVLRVFNAYLATRQKEKSDPEQMEENQKTLEELQLELLAKLNPENEEIEGEIAAAATVRIPAYIKLDSILFRSQGNKKAWVNSQKFVQGEGNGEIEVRVIGKDFVLLSIDTSDSTLSKSEIEEMVKNSRSSKSISYNDISESIIFNLSVNQYLDFTRMEIVEGSFDISKIDSNDPERKFYDPKIPADRFAPLEDESITEKVSGAAGDAVDKFKSNFKSRSDRAEEGFTSIDINEQ